MVAGRALRITAHYRLATGSAPPLLTHKIKLGSATIGQTGVIASAASQSNVQTSASWLLQTISPIGPAAQTECALLTNPSGATAAASESVTPMPATVATNAGLILKVTTLWATAGAGVNQIKLSQLIVEALN